LTYGVRKLNKKKQPTKMATNGTGNYEVPFSINSNPFFTELNKMDAGVTQLGENAASALKEMQGAFVTSANSADKLTGAIQADAKAVQVLREQAKQAGKDISDALSGKGVGEQFTARIAAIKQRLGSLTATSVDVGLNFDSAQIEFLENEIKKATTYTEEFNAVLDFSKKALADLEPGTQSFITLQTQIQTAEEFINKLNDAVANTTPTVEILTGEFDRLFGDPGQFLTKAEIDNLDETISKTTTDAEILTAQVSALSTKLGTLDPGTPKFELFKKAVDAGNVALAAMGVATVKLDEAQEGAEEKTVSLTTKLRQMREELALMAINGEENSEEYTELSDAAGELANQISGVSDRVKNLGSSTKYLDAGIGAITGLAGAFTAAQGAVALFGGESAKAQVIIQKVTGAMAVLQGIQALANALNKDSALGILLLSRMRAADTTAAIAETAATAVQTEATVVGTVATETNVVATEAQIVATEAQVVATEAATTATAGLTAALLLNPFTLIIAAITLAAIALIQFASASGDAEEATAKLNAALENQKDLFKDQLTADDNLTNLRIANANKRGAKDSEITEIEIKGLKEQIQTRQNYTRFLTEESKKLAKLHDDEILDDKEYYAQSDKISKERLANSDAIVASMAQIDLKAIAQKQQTITEQIALNQALVAQENADYNERKKLGALLVQSIKNIRDEQLKGMAEGNKKEIVQLKNSAKDRIDNIKASNRDYQQTIRQNNAEITLLNQQAGAGLIDPKIAAAKISDLRGQNALYSKIIKQGVAEQKAIQAGLNAELATLEKEYQRKRLEARLAANVEIAQSEKNGLQKDLNVLAAGFEQKKNQINTQYKDEIELRDALLKANEAKYNREVLRLRQEAALKEVEQDEQLDQIRVQLSGKFNEKNKKQQQLLNIELLKIQLEYAEKKLELLVDDGTKESQLVIAQQKKLIADLRKQIKDGLKDTQSFDVFDLFGLSNLDDNAKQALTTAFNTIKDSISGITDAIVAQYDRQIEAKQNLIDETESQIDDLEAQLEREKGLQANGLANNVAAIQAQLDAKKKEKEEEIKQQQELIKKRQAVQKAQLAIDTAAEASGLIVSAVNIFKSFSAIPFGLGIPLAIAAVGLMTGAFITAKANAFSAVNDNAVQFGEGGLIDGKSHDNGGQRYRSIDGGGGVIELEGGEYVMRKTVTDQYGDFLDGLNNGQLTEDQLMEFLAGTGVTLATTVQNEGVTEIRARDDAKVAYIALNGVSENAEDIKVMREALEYLVARKRSDPMQWEDNKNFYIKDGQTKTTYKKTE